LLLRPIQADPDVATALFQEHLDDLWTTDVPGALQLSRQRVDSRHELIGLTAVRTTARRDQYFALLGADFYDRWPPTVAFVDPEHLTQPAANSRWWPHFSSYPEWAMIEHQHDFSDGVRRQLVCYSFAADYYIVPHNLVRCCLWCQGRHTVTATITRLAELLRPPFYSGPADESSVLVL
jgi:hypothetical protein